jgi:hypothetical protein
MKMHKLAEILKKRLQKCSDEETGVSISGLTAEEFERAKKKREELEERSRKEVSSVEGLSDEELEQRGYFKFDVGDVSWTADKLIGIVIGSSLSDDLPPVVNAYLDNEYIGDFVFDPKAVRYTRYMPEGKKLNITAEELKAAEEFLKMQPKSE